MFVVVKIEAECYVCGNEEFTADDVCEPIDTYAKCPCCGFTIEI
ncbi:hypothetical protein LCGC14_0599710 [marine sediment metagenome]|uniref:Uncharacterized protein n=1 Tax=marine sediment metagenome TaxID=412755 RepID=A0A0F9TX47_9ZZZZ